MSADCLNEIFEYLEKDQTTLHSCLLVNRLWCQVSVRILWRNDWNYNIQTYNTLFACLSDESKDILHKNGIIISTPTLKSPMFNYATFCRDLSINHVNNMIKKLVENQFISTNLPQDINYKKCITLEEIFKLFMKQIYSLKKLRYSRYIYRYIPEQDQKEITLYPGAKNCLKDLSELYCDSNINSKFFYQLSQICQTIQLLNIEFNEIISDGLTDLISVQKNLKYLNIIIQSYYNFEFSKDLILSFTKISNTLIKLKFNRKRYMSLISLSFISKFTNLQELELSLNYHIKDFENVILSQLQILKIIKVCPEFKLLIIKFLENNGKNLKELYLGFNWYDRDNSSNLAISKFCTNLRKLSTGFCELETMKIVFNNCQYLESIKLWCGGPDFLNEKELLDVIVECPANNISELILSYECEVQSELLPEELESFFISWSNHIPQRPKLSLIIINISDDGLNGNDNNMKIIEKYIELGVINKFKVTDFDYTMIN